MRIAPKIYKNIKAEPGRQIQPIIHCNDEKIFKKLKSLYNFSNNTYIMIIIMINTNMDPY
jgi:hypothetical protein